MRSIEKLRDAIGYVERHNPKLTIETTVDAATAWVDEIESEMEREYMRLPVDAEGVPIRIGDKMERVAPEAYLVGSGEVVGYSFKDGEAAVLTQALPAPIHSRPNMLRPVRPDPIKELLEEFAEAVVEYDMTDDTLASMVDRFAFDIREAVEG